jgi:phage gpG-like protein
MSYFGNAPFGDEKRSIPARPFLGISDDEEAILDAFYAWISD